MKNEQNFYEKVQIGDHLLLVPNELIMELYHDRDSFLRSQLLWTHKDFTDRVFRTLDACIIISAVLHYKASRGEKFYGIELDPYDPETYPLEVLDLIRNDCTDVAMREVLRYYDQLQNVCKSDYFLCSYGWHSNSHNALEVILLDEKYMRNWENELTILHSGYTDFSRVVVENLLVKVGNLEKISEESISEPDINQIDIFDLSVPNEARLVLSDNFVILRGKEIFCGLHQYPAIWVKTCWEEIFDCNVIKYDEKERKIVVNGVHINLLCDIKLKHLAPNIQNDCYSVDKQCIKIIASVWDKLLSLYPNLEKVVVRDFYDEAVQRFLHVIFFDNENAIIHEDNIRLTYDRDYIITNGDNIRGRLLMRL